MIEVWLISDEVIVSVYDIVCCLFVKFVKFYKRTVKPDLLIFIMSFVIFVKLTI